MQACMDNRAYLVSVAVFIILVIFVVFAFCDDCPQWRPVFGGGSRFPPPVPQCARAFRYDWTVSKILSVVRSSCASLQTER